MAEVGLAPHMLPHIVALAGLTLAALPWASPEHALAADRRPNVVVVLTDDMEGRLLEFMPAVRRLIAEEGASLERAFFNDPLCCPSRATILTGRYAHNTKVTEQRYGLFLDNGNEPRTVAVWLDRAGYNTALVGKYMNGYGGTRVPPGWDYWAGKTGGADE